MSDTNVPVSKEEENLISAVRVLREFFGNRATNADWQRKMDTYARRGWSRAAFMRRLAVLKARGWIRVVSASAGGRKGDKTLQGAFYEATELAPGATEVVFNSADTPENSNAVSTKLQSSLGETGETNSRDNENGSDPVVPLTINELRFELAKAKQGAKELLKKGKSPHAA